MNLDPALLDQLALVYAHAAVDALLADEKAADKIFITKEENDDESGR